MMYSSIRRAVVPSRLGSCGKTLWDRCSGSHALQLCTAASTIPRRKKKKTKMEENEKVQNKLTRVLNSEIRCALDSDLLAFSVEASDGFPFEIEDNAGAKSIVLTREFGGDEIIRIHAYIPTAPARLDEKDDETTPTIPLVVTMSKENGSFLQIEASASPGRIELNDLSFNQSASAMDHHSYTGPDFSSLSEILRAALKEHVEVRGVDSCTANFIIEYMMAKDTKEYLRWLRCLKQVLQ